jgi:hypothetical protein
VRNFLWLAMLVAIPYMLAFPRPSKTAAETRRHDDSEIPLANPAANPTADANRYLEDSMHT